MRPLYRPPGDVTSSVLGHSFLQLKFPDYRQMLGGGMRLTGRTPIDDNDADDGKLGILTIKMNDREH